MILLATLTMYVVIFNRFRVDLDKDPDSEIEFHRRDPNLDMSHHAISITSQRAELRILDPN